MRPNLVFHNGAPCDGAAVAENFALQQASGLTGPAFTTIANVSVPSPLVVTVTMKSPWVPFDYYLAGGIGGQIAFIAEPNWLKSGSQTNPIGTGPFVFQAWNPNDHFTATRNPHYWRPNLPYLDSITYRPIPDSEQLLATLESGGVDMIHTSFSQVTGSLRANSSLGYTDDSVHVAGEPDMLCLLLNLAKPPFDNPKVRQAAAMAINSAQYSKVIENGICPPSNGPFVEGSPYFAPTGYPEPDPARAKQLIAEVQHETGQPVSVALEPHARPQRHQGSPSTSKQQLQRAGIRVSLNTIQQAELISTAVLGTYQAQVWRQFGAVHPDLNYIFWSPANADPSGIRRQHGPQHRPQDGSGSAERTPVPCHDRQRRRVPGGGQADGLRSPLHLDGRAVWSIGAQPKVQNWNNPTTPEGKPAFGMITGAIWPTQIWLSH